ncbi:MAG: TonB-dependent receptor [bacterium]
MKMSNPRSLIATAVLAALASPSSFGLDSPMTEVLVEAEFKPLPLMQSATSVSVFSADDLIANQVSHLEDTLDLAPNVNYASGASRARFIQIRGIGERSQFVEPRNPSVGIIVDGIDFSSIGTAATALDIKQVEVLRGPQGTLFGANALAGLINMTSNDPGEEQAGMVRAEFGDYNTRTISSAFGGPINESLGYRIAARTSESDGYTDNDFLSRDDTNNLDETFLRGKLRWQATDDLSFGLTTFYADIDNGYDAFSLDNTRTTLSDEPGNDRQKTVAAALSADWKVTQGNSLQVTLSGADSELEYGYDEDWTYVGFHPWEYSSTDNYKRDDKNLSADIRLVSGAADASVNWVLGLYLRDQDVELDRSGSYLFESDYETENRAMYGQVDFALTERLALKTGLRYEAREADYSDSNLLVGDFSQDDDFWGGNIVLQYQWQDALGYISVSRGYKAGGVNHEPAAPQPDFDAEYLWNYELGLKGVALENRLSYRLAVFYQDREDVQAKQSIFNPEDFSFDDYLANAASGVTTGAELEIDYQATNSLKLFGSLGLLDAEFRDFVTVSHVDARDDYEGIVIAPVDLDGRDTAHAPNYQFQVGAQLNLTDALFVMVDVEGKDSFYFSNSHDQKSETYELLNAKLGYRAENWDVSLWGRNLTDKDYFVRGFYFSNQFGNDPRDGYAPNTYVQHGAPRMIGVTGTYRF